MGAAVTTTIFFGTSVLAENPSSPPSSASETTASSTSEAEVARVIVTGSNIPTAEEAGPNPVDTYQKDDITRLGVRSPTDLVLKLPAVTGSGANENNTFDGRTEINLRGILPSETLVLQDGRRVTTSEIATVGGTVDLNVFPLGLIDHIDVLKDGASAIYGTDAVGGVFNVWLIHRFRGLEVYGSYGNTNLGFANDQAEERVYLLAGTGDDRTDIVVYAEFYNSAGIFARDTNVTHDADTTAFGGADFRSIHFAGNVQDFVYQRTLNGGAATPTAHAFPNPASDPQYVARLGLPREKQLFNYSDLTTIIAPVDREYLYASFLRDLCEKYMTLFSDFKYVRTFWDNAQAPTPFFPDVFTDATNPFGITSGGLSVPIQNAFNPFTVADYVSAGGFDPKHPETQASAAPPGTGFTTGVQYRSLEAGLRSDKVTTDDYIFTVGLKGNLGEFGDYLKTWEWETGFRYNEDQRTERLGGIVNNSALRTALLDSNPLTAFNPFGLNQNSKAAIDKVFVTLNNFGAISLELEDAKLTGDLLNLPAGSISFAIGGEHRSERVRDVPDSLAVSFDITGYPGGPPTRGNRDVWAVYWELRVPITSSAWDIPGLYSLEFDYQERYENFSDAGSTERPKFAVRWQPIDSAFTIRGTYNEAFHAADLLNLFLPPTEFLKFVFDPITKTSGQVPVISKGNPDLRPETAYEWTYGAVLTPGKWWNALQGLTLTADFYHIDLRAISLQLDPQFLVIHEAQFPGQVVRDPMHGNAIQLIVTPIQNLGRFIEEGSDYEVSYSLETSRLGHGDRGTVTATLNWTYLDRAVLQLVPGGPEQVVVGKLFGGLGNGSLTHNRWYASLFYDGAPASWLSGIDTGFTVHYAGQYWDDRFSTQKLHDRKVREAIVLDWIFSYTFHSATAFVSNAVAGYAKESSGKSKEPKDKNILPISTSEYNSCGWRSWLNNTTVTLGINNVFDEQPPFAAGANFEFDGNVASIKGRTWYVALKKRF